MKVLEGLKHSPLTVDMDKHIYMLIRELTPMIRFNLEYLETKASAAQKMKLDAPETV